MATVSAQIRGGAVQFAASIRARLAGNISTNRAGDTVVGSGPLILWAPVCFAIGIGIFFVLPSDPYPGLAAGIGVLFGVAAWSCRHAHTAALLCLSIVVAALGFTAIEIRSASVSAPVLKREIGPVIVSGRIVRSEPAERGYRVTLDRLRISDARITEVPERARVTIRSAETPPAPGKEIEIRAILRPPPVPSLPGGYDFARKAWFERLGAVGFGLGQPIVNEGAEGTSWRIALARLRLDLTERILEKGGADAPVSAVAAALLTGERRAIPEEVLADMRDSGLAHLLAISGLHIGLVAGLLFFAVRLGLALIERVALRYPIKKIAAVAAIIGAFAYLLISGITIPTQRAFLMVSIVMLAVIIDRTAISMRLVALAAMVVLIAAPESLLSASFQMSFAAVIGLVAFYEAAAPRLNVLRRNGGILGSRVGLFIAATLLTTLIASAATAPFAIYHFNRIALYGLLANLLAVPVMAMWIMPLGILSFLLMPFGLESIGLVPMGWGISVVLAVAEYVADLPGAVALVPPMPTLGLAGLAVGGVWLCCVQGGRRFYGIAAIAAGMGSIVAVTPPDILIHRSGKLVAVKMGQGRVVVTPGNRYGFERDMWRRRQAVEETEKMPAHGISPAGGIGCDSAGCIATVSGRTLALISDPDVAQEDCGRADHVILLTRLPRGLCRGEKVILSTFHLWRDGAHAIRFSGAVGVQLETVRETRGDRPWSRISEKQRQYVRTSPTSRP